MRRLVIPLPHIAPVWSAFGSTVADVVHVYQRPQRHRLPVEAAVLEAVFAELEEQGSAVLAAEGFTAERTELRRSLRMRYAAQVHDIEVPLEPGAPLDSDAVTAAFASLYEALHGVGSGHPEGGIAITTLVIRARGLTEPLELATPPFAERPHWSSRQVYWYEQGGFADTALLRLQEGGVDEKLQGPLLIELPDTVVVVRPGQSAHFGKLGSLTIEL